MLASLYYVDIHYQQLIIYMYIQEHMLPILFGNHRTNFMLCTVTLQPQGVNKYDIIILNYPVKLFNYPVKENYLTYLIITIYVSRYIDLLSRHGANIASTI